MEDPWFFWSVIHNNNFDMFLNLGLRKYLLFEFALTHIFYATKLQHHDNGHYANENNLVRQYIIGLEQNCGNSSASELELPQSCTKRYILWYFCVEASVFLV